MESKDTNLGIQTLAGSGAMAIQQILGFGSAVVLGYIVGPAGFGGFYLMMAIVDIGDTPIQGWSVASRKFYAESDRNRSQILGSEILFAVVLSLAGVLCIVVFRRQLDTLFGFSNGWAMLAALYVVAVFFRPLHELLTATGQVAQKEGLATAHSTVKFGLQVVLLVLGFGVLGMVSGYVVASLVILPVALKLLGQRPVWPSRETISDIYHFAKFSMINATVQRTFNRFDLLLLGALATPTIAGHYEAAFKLTLPAFVVSSVAAGSIMARVSNLQSLEEDPSGDVQNVLSYASILAIPIFFGVLALGSPLLVYAFGTGFAEAGTLLVGLALWRILASQNNVLSSIVNGANLPRKNAIISAVALALNISVGVALFFILGPIGIVIGTIIAGATKYIGLLAVVLRTFPGTSPVPRPLAIQFVSGAIMYGIVVFLRNLYGTGSILYISFLIGTGALVYGLCTLALSSHLRQTARGILRDLQVENRMM